MTVVGSLSVFAALVSASAHLSWETEGTRVDRQLRTLVGALSVGFAHLGVYLYSHSKGWGLLVASVLATVFAVAALSRRTTTPATRWVTLDWDELLGTKQTEAYKAGYTQGQVDMAKVTITAAFESTKDAMDAAVRSRVDGS